MAIMQCWGGTASLGCGPESRDVARIFTVGGLKPSHSLKVGPGLHFLYTWGNRKENIAVFILSVWGGDVCFWGANF